MLNEILDVASKYVDSAEAYYLESESLPVNFEVGSLKSIESKSTKGIALRVIKNGKLGFSVTTDLDTNKVEQLVKKAVEVSELGPEVNWNFPTHKVDSSRNLMKSPPDIERMVSIGKDMLEEVKTHEPEAINSASLIYSKSREIIMNTNGVSAHRERDAVSLSLVSQLINGNDILYVYDGQTITSSEINYKETLEKVLATIKNSKAIFQVNTKNMPVIFTPRAMSSLLIPLEPALNGRAVLQGSSYFTKKLNTQVMDSRINIYEDPTQGAYNLTFDDEGVVANRKPYIENGVLKNFYYDIQTASEAGVQSSGNGFRSGLSNVSPSISSLVFDGGDKTFEEMISEIEEGVIVEHVLGAGQGNTLSGAFSVNISLGFLIEKGKIVGRIKDCMVAGNTFDALNSIGAIEKNSHWLSSGTRKYPSVMFNNLNVVSKK